MNLSMAIPLHPIIPLKRSSAHVSSSVPCSPATEKDGWDLWSDTTFSHRKRRIDSLGYSLGSESDALGVSFPQDSTEAGSMYPDARSPDSSHCLTSGEGVMPSPLAMVVRMYWA